MRTITIKDKTYRLIQFFDDQGRELEGGEGAVSVLCQPIDVLYEASEDQEYLLFTGLKTVRRVQ